MLEESHLMDRSSIVILYKQEKKSKYRFLNMLHMIRDGEDGATICNDTVKRRAEISFPVNIN